MDTNPLNPDSLAVVVKLYAASSLAGGEKTVSQGDWLALARLVVFLQSELSLVTPSD